MKMSGAACLAVCLAASARVLIAAPADDGGQLVGAWRLVSWEARLADGSTRKNPMSTGSLIYSDSGRMCAMLMDPNRAKWTGQPDDAQVPAENGPNIVESRLIWERVSR
jgi:hypothetical protein